MSTVAKEVAEKEIENWLNYKKVGTKKREQHEDTIETLVYAVMDGDLSLSTDFNLLHQLKFPINDREGNVALEKLSYKPRIDGVELEKKQTDTKIVGAQSVYTPYIATLTDTAVGLIKKLDTEDLRIANSIAVFFM